MEMGTFALIFAACGESTTENVTNINQMGMEVVSSEENLPKCTSDNEGEQVFVKGETSARICVDGEWFATASGNTDFSCKTEELKDGSGLKIVCNGDSIGVVLNGEAGKDGIAGKNGENGKDGSTGAGCSISDKTDSTMTVVCGESKMILSVGGNAANYFFEADSERIAVNFDSLAGFTQKGPFLKGSTVYLYELSDGRTLKQTNGNFTSIITRDDGRYKFTARDLVSQYAMVVVEGYYRNEVTGAVSDAPIRLRALTDLRKHQDANVNLLTHLEYDRVYYLVTRGDSTGKKLTVKQAKQQAQKEILKQFYIELDENTDAEDMNVFGSSDADAALLALSILLQGDSNSTNLSVLATEISNAITETGKWDGENAAAVKAGIADWLLDMDLQGKLANYRNNVNGWGLSATVPYFEKYLRRFTSIENGLGVCGSESVPVGTVKNVSNSNSKYYASSYSTTSDKGGETRFICVDADSARWRVATNIEKDTVGWEKSCTDGEYKQGLVTGEYYQCRSGEWDPNVTFFPYSSIVEYTDHQDGGMSTITWEPQDYDMEEAFRTHADFHLKLLDGYDYPCAGIQINLGDAQDIRDWGGVCLRYKSTISFGIELLVEDEESVTNFDNYKASVPKNINTTYSCFPWSKFKQGNWGISVAQEEVLKKIVAVRLKVEATAGSEGDLTIYQIDHYGEN